MLRDRLAQYADPSGRGPDRWQTACAELGLCQRRADYASACARDLFTPQGLLPAADPPRRCASRGIEDWLAEEAAAQIDEEESDQRLLALVRRKYASETEGQGQGGQRPVKAGLQL